MIYKYLFNTTYLKTKVSTIVQGLLILVIIVFSFKSLSISSSSKAILPSEILSSSYPKI